MSGDSNFLCTKISVKESGNNELEKHFFVVKDKVEETGVKEMLHKIYSADFHEKMKNFQYLLR